MLPFLILMFLSAVCLVVGGGYEYSEKLVPLKWLLIIMGVSFGLCAIWEIVKDFIRENTENMRKREWAKAKPVIETANAIRGLSNGQTELVSKQMYFHVEGTTLADEGILWRVNFPGGTVPLEFIHQFLISSLNTAPYSHPIRNHMHPDFADFTNVEEMLAILTRAFIAKGWLQKAEGPYSAKLAPGESFQKIGNRFNLIVE